MSDESPIPVLREVIRRGASLPPATEKDVGVTHASDEDMDAANELHGDEIEREYHSALREIQASQMEIDLDALPDEIGQSQPPGDTLDSAPDIQELLIDEEIRSILDRHIDAAYRDILQLINHKIK